MTKNSRFRSIARMLPAVCLAFFAQGYLSLAQAQGSPDASIVAAPQSEMKGIWGAIAYSTSDERVGMFWGADKKEEAERNALRHCENNRGTNCRIVTVFRNHRDLNKDDESGFPYEHCGALAIGVSGAVGAASAASRAEAEEKSLESCGGDGKMCKIREWVCT